MRRSRIGPVVRAFTVLEMVVSMGASVIVLGGLMLSSLTLQRSLTGSERYATAFSDQRRLIDFVGRDLRRSVGVAVTDASGARLDAAARTVSIQDRAGLIVTLPGYYQSEVKSAPGYATALEVVGTEERLDYGTSAGLAAPVEVTFRKVYVAKERATCFVRQEAGVEEVIVWAADQLFIEVTVLPGAQTATLRAWFRAPYRTTAPLVSTFERVLLRNPPLSLKP